MSPSQMKNRAFKKERTRIVNKEGMKITRKNKAMRKKGLFKVHLSTSWNRSRFTKHKILKKRKIKFMKRKARANNQF